MRKIPSIVPQPPPMKFVRVQPSSFIFCGMPSELFTNSSESFLHRGYGRKKLPPLPSLELLDTLLLLIDSSNMLGTGMFVISEMVF